MYQGLMEYRNRTTDHPTQVWLDDWKARTTSLLGSALLAPLIDNRDDYEKLRKTGMVVTTSYAAVTLQKSSFAWHTICAILHNVYIKALTGKPAEADEAVPDRIKGHLEASRSHGDYRRAFQDASTLQDWSVLHAFFATSLAHESV
ncbi:hypothetical protein DD238_003245 [Peronospora effusa]|uniref:Uncharacterized protein n=1 Tax=Peronospora effusa TaxID=542832 RepID=A0A3M6VVN9_9STRA|nr:hypothetical protein DD238_003245 [Peronospora effusa]